ncbi:flippase [Acinetobacter sp. YH12226]|uniref:flippase n=1 Tax=Acinetobacter sp. YH12226 TaxID=2601157 RepID=UPI0015D3F85D|nr:flippase [Acinetobacter sp. YH12226]
MKIAKNSFFNIAGYIIPGILSIPILGYMARELGIEEFGLFTIILALVGYASIFDVGITRSVIREIAIFKNNEEEVLKIISTSALLVLILGVVAGVLIIVFSSIISELLKVSSYAVENFQYSLMLLSLSIPLFLLTQIWCSLLEGREEFLKLNIFKTISSTLVVLLPAIGLMLDSSLLSAVIGLLISRVISIILVLWFCKEYIVKLKFHKETFKRLINFGGWIAVSNIISPIMSYFDRFILANKVGSNVVGFYTGPSEAISRIGIFPSAIARTIFPMLSDKEADNKQIKKISYLLVFLSIVPFGIIAAYFAENILDLWLGSQFALKSTLIFQVLVLGLIFNSIAQVPFTSIQAQGGSKVTAILHLFEVIPYVLLLLYLIQYYGLLGAAWAWTIRMFVDMGLLIFLDQKNILKEG